MRSAWKRVNKRTTAASASRSSLRLAGLGTTLTAPSMDSTGMTCYKIGFDGFAHVKIGLRWRPHRHSGTRFLLHCHHLQKYHTLSSSHGAGITGSSSGTSCDTGASSRATGQPRQGRNKTLRSLMSAAFRTHASGSLGTNESHLFRNIFFLTLANIDNVLCPPHDLLLQKMFLILLRISTA